MGSAEGGSGRLFVLCLHPPTLCSRAEWCGLRAGALGKRSSFVVSHPMTVCVLLCERTFRVSSGMHPTVEPRKSVGKNRRFPSGTMSYRTCANMARTFGTTFNKCVSW